jgi:hypothetical protein
MYLPLWCTVQCGTSGSTSLQPLLHMSQFTRTITGLPGRFARKESQQTADWYHKTRSPVCRTSSRLANTDDTMLTCHCRHNRAALVGLWLNDMMAE